MFRIGIFAQMNRVTVKTLRHYETEGLLKPAEVDDFTGYRYYEANQMPILHKIVALKQAGCSLREIRLLIDSSSTDKLVRQLETNLENMQGEESNIKKKIQHTKSYIKFIKEENIMAKDIVVKELPEIIVASMHLVIPNYDALYEAAPKMGRIMKKQGAVCADSRYCFNMYHDEGIKKENINLEICEEVVEALPGGEGVVYKTMPKVEKAACLLHKGPFSTLGNSYSILYKWIKDNDYQKAGMDRESYIDGPWNKDNDEDWLTEIQIPIE